MIHGLKSLKLRESWVKMSKDAVEFKRVDLKAWSGCFWSVIRALVENLKTLRFKKKISKEGVFYRRKSIKFNAKV